MIGPSGNPMPASGEVEMTKPATPERASWTTEIWPTKPVMTTSERVSTAAIIELISAWRKSKGKTIRQMPQARPPSTAGRSSRSGRGTIGRPFSISSPRRGRLAPRRKSAITIRTKMSSDCTPGQGDAVVGREPGLRRDVVEDVLGRSPMPRPTRAGDADRGEVGEEGRGERRHDLEGQRARVDRGDTGAARTPSVPTIRHASSVLTIERRLGERPASIAETSFSEAARVARPKRVQR